MKSSVIVFPGSNCDRDIAVALKKFQIKNQMVWHGETTLPKSDLVVLPGGFSYGDYLRAGCIASKSRIINEVITHAKKGGLILGICNGFQILIESGLLPGVLLRNKKLRFLSKNVFLKVLNINNQFCLNYKKKDIIELPIAHNEGNYFASYELLQNLTIGEQSEVSDGQTESLEEIWYGKEIQKVRKSHYKNMLDEVGVCSSCTYTDTFVWDKI